MKCLHCGSSEFVPEAHEYQSGCFKTSIDLASCLSCGTTYLVGGSFSEIDE